MAGADKSMGKPILKAIGFSKEKKSIIIFFFFRNVKEKVFSAIFFFFNADGLKEIFFFHFLPELCRIQEKFTGRMRTFQRERRIGGPTFHENNF